MINSIVGRNEASVEWNGYNADGHGGHIQRDHIGEQRPTEGSACWVLHHEVFGKLKKDLFQNQCKVLIMALVLVVMKECLEKHWKAICLQILK